MAPGAGHTWHGHRGWPQSPSSQSSKHIPPESASAIRWFCPERGKKLNLETSYLEPNVGQWGDNTHIPNRPLYTRVWHKVLNWISVGEWNRIGKAGTVVLHDPNFADQVVISSSLLEPAPFTMASQRLPAKGLWPQRQIPSEAHNVTWPLSICFPLPASTLLLHPPFPYLKSSSPIGPWEVYDVLSSLLSTRLVPMELHSWPSGGTCDIDAQGIALSFH